MTHEQELDPVLRVKRQVIRLGSDMFYSSNLLRMRVTCQECPVSMKKIGGTVMAGGMVTTNGKSLNFHPDYVRQIDDDRIVYHIKKAVLQVALKHNLVKDKLAHYNSGALNAASSLAINFILMYEDGMPAGAPRAGASGTWWEYLNDGMPMEHYAEALQEVYENEQATKEAERDNENNDDGTEGNDEDSGEEGESGGTEGSGPDGPETDEGDGGDAGDEAGDEGEGDTPEDGDESSDSGSGEDSQEGSEGGSSGKPVDPGTLNDFDIDPEPDWNDLPDNMDAGDVEQHPEANEDNIEELRSKSTQQTMKSVAQCDGCGGVPGLIKEAFKDLLRPSELDYKTMLRRFCNTVRKQRYSYVHPNRRHAWRGSKIILPTRHSRGLGKIVFAVDTSVSMDAADINRSLDEIAEIMATWPSSELVMIECSTSIGAETTVSRFNVDKLRKRDGWTGRGGTDLRPPFVRAQEIGNVKCVIYLTDLQGPQPEKGDVTIPTIWLATDDKYAKPGKQSKWGRSYYPEFGEVVVLPPVKE